MSRSLGQCRGMRKVHQDLHTQADRIATGVRNLAARLGLEPLEQRLALTALPAGFTETLITTNSNLSSPTAMEISPTGEIWVLEQAGDVEFIRADGSKHTALDLTVNSSGERGLLGIAFDPAYDGAGPTPDYVYLYYTKPAQGPDPADNQVVRYTITGAGTATPMLVDELMIRELPPEAEDGDTNHNGGAIHFGPDGKLYVAVGDHNYDPPGSQQATHVSQRLDTPFGKMLRINADGSNPSDNPFFTGSSTDWQGSIWALGLRNPFTFAIDPADGRVFINDVGEGAWEEINAGEAAANYGWAGSNAPVWEGFENDGSPPPWANYRDPIMAYNHSSDPPTPAAVNITGGVFYPANGNFGADFAGKYFFADAGANFIRYFDPANPGTVAVPDTSSPFASQMSTFGPVDLKVDAQGHLYYLARGGEVYRISYTGDYGPSQIVGRHVFYNDSAFDDSDPAITPDDDGAIAIDKVAYLPGSGIALPSHVTSYSQGINGIMIDVDGNHGPLTLADFSFRTGTDNSPGDWVAAPATSGFEVRAGAGVGGSDRVVITWPSFSISNTWLEVRVLANESTGLPASDVFYFGNKVADSFTGTTATHFETTPADVLQIFSFAGSNKPITDLRDYNRDAQITPSDGLIVFANAGSLLRINIPFASPQSAAPLAIANDDREAVAAALAVLAYPDPDAAPLPLLPAPHPESAQQAPVRSSLKVELESHAELGPLSSFRPENVDRAIGELDVLGDLIETL